MECKSARSVNRMGIEGREPVLSSPLLGFSPSHTIPGMLRVPTDHASPAAAAAAAHRTIQCARPARARTAPRYSPSRTVVAQADAAGLGLVGSNELRVAYQGAPGAYSEQACMLAYDECEPVPCSQFEHAFLAVTEWRADRAVLPIENSLGGSIHRNYDLLLKYRLHIVGEVGLPINHCIMALPGTKKEEIVCVQSHPQALAQCENYLNTHYPNSRGVVHQATDDTADSAKRIAQEDIKGYAAIASRRAAELYDMEILDEGIQDDKLNVTRFVALAREPVPIKDDDGSQRQYKTSIVFTLKEGPGVLFKALSVFALRDINLTKLESRPMRAAPIVTDEAGSVQKLKRFNFVFYCDFVGGTNDATVQNALRHLGEIAPYMRVLGSYPMHETDLSHLSTKDV